MKRKELGFSLEEPRTVQEPYLPQTFMSVPEQAADGRKGLNVQTPGNPSSGFPLKESFDFYEWR